MSLSNILQIERERVKRERVVLDTVYERMNNRINSSVRVGAKTCIYAIPDMIPGYPLVNLEKTMLYLFNKLKKEGFIVFPLSEHHLFITWDPREIKKLDKLNKEHTQTKRINHIDTSEKENDDFITSLIKSKHQDREQ